MAATLTSRAGVHVLLAKWQVAKHRVAAQLGIALVEDDTNVEISVRTYLISDVRVTLMVIKGILYFWRGPTSERYCLKWFLLYFRWLFFFPNIPSILLAAIAPPLHPFLLCEWMRSTINHQYEHSNVNSCKYCWRCRSHRLFKCQSPKPHNFYSWTVRLVLIGLGEIRLHLTILALISTSLNCNHLSLSAVNSTLLNSTSLHVFVHNFV